MSADPVVSPADTRRRDEAAMRMLAQSQVSHFGTGSGITGVPSCDRCGKPTNRWNEPCDYLPDTAHLLAEDVLALLAVGERDKAERDAAIAAAADLTVEIDEAHAERDAALNAGERDRRQIARLTEALERIRANLTIDSREGVWDPSEAKKIARAVLADEEDAGDE